MIAIFYTVYLCSSMLIFISRTFLIVTKCVVLEPHVSIGRPTSPNPEALALQSSMSASIPKNHKSFIRDARNVFMCYFIYRLVDLPFTAPTPQPPSRSRSQRRQPINSSPYWHSYYINLNTDLYGVRVKIHLIDWCDVMTSICRETFGNVWQYLQAIMVLIS